MVDLFPPSFASAALEESLFFQAQRLQSLGKVTGKKGENRLFFLNIVLTSG